MTWKPELDDLARREAFAREMGGVDKVKRQRDQGRLTVRDRIDKIVDQKSFHEIGAISGIAEYDENNELKHLTPANCVFGRARVDGRTVVVVGDDFTVRGGSADASISAKPLMAEEMAHDFRLPIIRDHRGLGRRRLGEDHRNARRGQSARRRRRHALVLVHDGQFGARARGRTGARLGRRSRRGAAGGQPLFRHDQELRDVRRGAAGGETPGPGFDETGTRRRRDPDPRRRRRPCRRNRGRSVRMRPALPVLSAVVGLRIAADHCLQRRSGTRGRVADEGGAAQPPSGLQDAADHRRRRRQGLVLRGRPPISAVRSSRGWRGWKAARCSCWRAIPSTMAAPGPRKPARRWCAGSTSPRPSICRWSI